LVDPVEFGNVTVTGVAAEKLEVNDELVAV